MYFSILLIPVIGLLISVGDLSQSIKLALLGSLGAAFAYDLMDCKRRSRPLIGKLHFALIVVFQAYLTYSWIDVYLSKPIGLEISRFMLAVLAGSPWILIWQLVATESRSPRILGLPPCGLAVIVWSLCTVILSRLGIGSDSSMLTYGRVVEGGVLGEFRSILPGFPGIVAGGIFCGMGLVYSISGFLSCSNRFQRAFYAIAGCACGYGIYVTDVRSATGVSIVVLLLGVTLVVAAKLRGFGSSDLSSLLIRNGVIATAAFPFLFPFAVPLLDQWAERTTFSLFSTAVTRSDSESVLSFGGRSKVWEVATDLAIHDKLALLSFNSVGEYGAGVSYALFEAVMMPGSPESAHSHNSALNFYFSFGIFGLAVLIAIVCLLGASLYRGRLGKLQLVYLLPFFAFMVFMTLESLFSVSYTYFGLCFTLYNIDVIRERNSKSDM